MKKLIVVVFTLLLTVSFSYAADQYCQWSGTEAETCLSPNSKGIYYPAGKVRTRNPLRLNEYGYFLLVTTQPTIGADQKRGAIQWGFNGAEISRTWAVDDLTAEEIAQREASAMPLSEYYLWKVLVATGTVTVQQIQSNLPQELVDAYLARDALENP